MRVVLVDPSRTVLKFVSRLLEARGDEVRPFTDGRAALAYVAADPMVDALITSAEPLSISGLELCWETRLVAGDRRSIYVILMSSNQERRNLIEALDSGADDFIGKPPAAEELYARLRAAERLATMHRDLVQLASLDPLTGIFNRRVFFERAQAALARRPEGGAMAAIMLDIDYFKRVNDIYGHALGDRAIREVASLISSTGEIVGRLGGEEFAIFLPGRGMAGGMEIAERLRREVMMLNLPVDGKIVTLTASFGVSKWHSGESVDEMLRCADMALYSAKEQGRNRVVSADDALTMKDYEAAERPVRAAQRSDASPAQAEARSSSPRSAAWRPASRSELPV
jgi:two-component system, cell cycle response regulator